MEYSGGYSVVNPLRFGQAFVERVANPREILNFYKQRQSYGSLSVICSCLDICYEVLEYVGL